MTALAVIYVAKKYLVNKIDTLALSFVNKNVTSDNVLMVLQHLYVLHQKDSEVRDVPSAPQLGLLEKNAEVTGEQPQPPGTTSDKERCQKSSSSFPFTNNSLQEIK